MSNKINLRISSESYEGLARAIMRRSSKKYIHELERNNSPVVNRLADAIELYLKREGVRTLEPGIIIDIPDSLEDYLPQFSNPKPINTKGVFQSTGNESDINNVTVLWNDLLFKVKYFETFENYCYKDQHTSLTTKELNEISDIDERDLLDYGVIGLTSYNVGGVNAVSRRGAAGRMTTLGYHGDRGRLRNMSKGYVHIFKKPKLSSQYILAHTFVVTDEKYQEVVISPNDMSYDEKVGGQKEYMRVPGFHPPHQNGVYLTPEPHFVVVSKIKLTAERLFTSEESAIINDPSKRGIRIHYSRDRLREMRDENRRGEEILDDYQNKRGELPPLETYNIQYQMYEGIEGFDLLVADYFEEVKRRGSLFVERLQAFNDWTNDEVRNKQAFMYQAVKGMRYSEDESLTRLVKDEKFDDWWKEDHADYLRYYFRSRYALMSLIELLEDEKYVELMRDYSFSAEEEQLEALEIYKDATYQFHLTNEGTEYLLNEINDRYSYISRILPLNEDYFDDNRFLDSFLELRKYNHLALALLENIAPIIAAKNWDIFGKLSAFIQKYFNITIQFHKIKPIVWLNQEVTTVKIFKNMSRVKAISSAISSCLEVFNLSIAIVQLCRLSESWDSMSSGRKAAELSKNAINVIGAVCDFSSGSWFISSALENKLGVVRGVKVLAAIELVSGICDCILGVWACYEAMERGENWVAVGWGIFAAGGFIIALGAALKLAGVQATVGSGGTAVPVTGAVVLAGVTVEAIGLFIVSHFNNREVKDWLRKSIFGVKNELEDQDDRSQIYLEKITEHMQELNDIMCNFNVKAKFKDLEFSTGNNTCVAIRIEPRLITEMARIRIFNVEAKGKVRLLEVFSFNPKNWETGFTGGKEKTLDMRAAYYSDEEVREKRLKKIVTIEDNITKIETDDFTLYQESGKVTAIETDYLFNMDIDEVEGAIKLDLNRGTLQGLTKDFKVTPHTKDSEVSHSVQEQFAIEEFEEVLLPKFSQFDVEGREYVRSMYVKDSIYYTLKRDITDEEILRLKEKLDSVGY